MKRAQQGLMSLTGSRAPAGIAEQQHTAAPFGVQLLCVWEHVLPLGTPNTSEAGAEEQMWSLLRGFCQTFWSQTGSSYKHKPWLGITQINPAGIGAILKWKDGRMDASFKDILPCFLVRLESFFIHLLAVLSPLALAKASLCPAFPLLYFPGYFLYFPSCRIVHSLNTRAVS